ncbi:MAG: YrdB family protein [Planctomycetes bacterium]|nr:YrdB family protein [Planctomycetota bacterium]
MATWNLGLRFLLELMGLISVGWWGWVVVDSWPRYLLAPGLPLLLAILWGVFNVREDPSRSGKAPVPVPGPMRLLLECILLGGGAVALGFAWSLWASVTFGAVLVFHYIASWKRVLWLLR